MPICGAKKRSGDICKGSAMTNGKCRMHGGKSTGPPADNQNAVKHGFYSKCYTPEELIDIEKIKVGTLEAELHLAKTQLRRAAVISQFEEDGKTPNEKYRPDVIERLLAVVGRLEKQHFEISVGTDTEEFSQDDEFL